LPLEWRAASELGGYMAGGAGFALEKPAEIRNLRLRPGHQALWPPCQVSEKKGIA